LRDFFFAERRPAVVPLEPLRFCTPLFCEFAFFLSPDFLENPLCFKSFREDFSLT